MGKRLLVTGCGGFVGGSIVHETPVGVELHAVTRRESPADGGNAAWHVVDLLDQHKVRGLFEAVAPDAVIHAAAIGDIDFCEANQTLARETNVGVTEQLAELCRDHGARLVYVSTDNVFDGVRGSYTEDDLPIPVNYYAETKAAAEHAVAAFGENFVVARTSVVVGFPMLGAGNSFLTRMVPQLSAGNRVGVPPNEIRTPIDVVTLAKALLELAEADYHGYIHLAGNDRLSRYEMVRRIAREMGFREELVYPNNPETLPGRAPRPLDVSLCNNKARACLKTPMMNLQDGLRLALRTARPTGYAP